MKELECKDIQGIVRFGYGYLPCSRYLFLQLGESRRARAMAKEWLGTLVDEVSTAEQVSSDKRPKQVLQIAFSAKGLEELGLFEEKRAKKTFLPEFLDGMAEAHRAQKLGDTGESAPEHWKFGGPATRPIHLVLVLFAKTPEELDTFYQSHRKRYAAAQVEEVFTQDAMLRRVPSMPGNDDKPLFVEPFGYMDGISQVLPRGFLTAEEQKARRNVVEIEPGEFILGYRNAYEQKAVAPMVPAAMDREDILEASKASPAWKELGRNGTYLVIRKLRQDVQGFEEFLEKHSEYLRDEAAQAQADPKELLAAKLMGRWRSGAPLSLCPHQDDPQLGIDIQRNNTFSYADDPRGLHCPISSHIRRSNPRDSFCPDKPKESFKIVNRHQLIRRGRPYREPASDGLGGVKEGLMFVAINTNIGRQFEFIQQTWINSPKFDGLYDSRDPITGDNHDPALADSHPDSYAVAIPAHPVRKRITGVPRFVHTEGGGYFFLPGIRALRFLCSLSQETAFRADARVARDLYGS